jgi:hypothetical protein
MGLSPRVVTEDVVFLWDGAPQRLPKGQVIDVAPDSPLERAIGRQRLIPHGLPAASPAPAAAPAAAEAVVPRQDKPPASPKAKKQDSAKEGES